MNVSSAHRMSSVQTEAAMAAPSSIARATFVCVTAEEIPPPGEPTGEPTGEGSGRPAAAVESQVGPMPTSP